MSLYGTLNTAVSGMAAQANMLGTIGDNIANSNTVGYKGASVQFETLLGNTSATNYESGGVQSRVRYGIADQGNIIGTSSVTNLAVSGDGFFVVQSPSGSPVLTRAGDFVPDGSGNLVNAAGYKLMAYNLTDGSQVSANGVGGLQVVNVAGNALSAAPSTAGTLSINVPSSDKISTALPSANANPSVYSGKTSLVAYDSLGKAVNMDIYFAKSAANTWEVSAYDNATADPTTHGFPYATNATSTSPVPLVAAQTLTFDPDTGKLASGNPLTMTIPNSAGGASTTLTLDVNKMSQLATGFTINTATVDGSSPSTLDHIAISKDGTITSIYKNGIQKSTYQIPLATVTSPDELTPLAGNVYEQSLSSGDMVIGKATTGPFGAIDSSSLEQSTVDIATQLTNMITAQRGYEANSKVIQTSSDLLSVITNLK